MLSPYTIIAAAWAFLGIGTGIVAAYPLSRLIFIGISWFLFEAGWDYLEYYKRTTYCDENDDVWTRLKLRVVSYSRPLFYVWLGVMVHHIIWWVSGFVILDRNRIIFGWTQSAFVLFCATVSFVGKIATCSYRRNYLKWIMMIAAFLLPPWRHPWYSEPLIVLQVRWIIMALLFVVQCFESYAQASSEKRHLADLYLLRIGWVPIVHPILLLFAIISMLYYGFTMIKIRIETHVPHYAPLLPPKRQEYGAAGGRYYNTYGTSALQTAPDDVASILDSHTFSSIGKNTPVEGYQQTQWEHFSAYTRPVNN